MSRIDAASSFRVQGEVISFAELAKNKPGFAIRATDEQIQEMKLHDAQMQAREAAAQKYATEYPDRVYAQVFVNGQLAGWVHESGGAATVQNNVPGLHFTEDGSGLDLAKTRLAEMLKAFPASATVKYLDLPPRDEPFGGLESMLPPVTARGLSQFADEMSWNLARTRMEAETGGKEA